MTMPVQINVIMDGVGICVYLLDSMMVQDQLKMVLTKDVASRILQRNLSELILLATQTKLTPDNNSNNTFLSSSIYQIKVPETCRSHRSSN